MRSSTPQRRSQQRRSISESIVTGSGRLGSPRSFRGPDCPRPRSATPRSPVKPVPGPSNRISGRGPACSFAECLSPGRRRLPRGRLGRALGHSHCVPMPRLVQRRTRLRSSSPLLSWRRGGQFCTGLRRSAPGNSDIDHVILGPGGIFTITMKNHSGQEIWIGEAHSW
jgi:hypothetical protein